LVVSARKAAATASAAARTSGLAAGGVGLSDVSASEEVTVAVAGVVAGLEVGDGPQAKTSPATSQPQVRIPRL
jgi:hypothetical protein